jgi:glucose/arabinose dehydrogenase
MLPGPACTSVSRIATRATRPTRVRRSAQLHRFTTALKQGGHVAPNGLRFYTGSMFPPPYRHRLFIAQHGSWNRSEKSGYRVMMVTLEGDKVSRYEVFARGWMENETAWGRPVDLLVMPDGALLISDDQAGVVYRVTYNATGQ